MCECAETKEMCLREEEMNLATCCVANRFFEIVPEEYRRYPDAEIRLPFRATANSACYDMCTPCDVTVPANRSTIVTTDVRAYMQPGEVLMLYPRSSMGKIPMRLCNGTGVIDSDYYDNPGNGGNIGVMLQNMSDAPVNFKAGERICQAMFIPYLITDDDAALGKRTGGFGSTGN